MVKNYLLDTSILLDNPHNLYGFEDNNIYICGTTLQELDRKKTAPGDIGYNARESCRILDELRTLGDLTKGIKLENGGTLFIEPNGIDQALLPKGYSIDVPDNRIISSCLWLNKEKQLEPQIILLTNDVSMRVNATICGLEAQGVLNDIIEESHYTGHVDIEVSSEIIDIIHRNKHVSLEDIKRIDEELNSISREAGCDESNMMFTNIDSLLMNEFVTLHADNKSALSVCKGKELKLIQEKTIMNGIKPLNKMQVYAIWALTAPVEEIPLIILQGDAGTAKTFLSLAAGLSQVYLGQGRRNKDEFSRMMIARPNTQTSDPDFGYLPGELEEKMAPLIAAYRDNLEEILGGKDGDDKESINTQVDDLFDSGIIELAPLNYIRGRSLHNTYLICDEAQNANKILIRDVVTRAGRHSKFVIAGDPKQCDVANLDKHNNGLVYAVETMKGSSKVAIITFDHNQCVRSELAEEAIMRMKI